MDKQNFTAAIAQEPNDESLRLIYADWLEEHGDAIDQACAGLIRLQIGLQNTPRDEWSEDQRAEERRLLNNMMPMLEGWRQREGRYGWGSRPEDTLNERLDALARNFECGFMKPEVEGECHRVNTFVRAMGGQLADEPFFKSIKITNEYLDDFGRDDLLMAPHLDNVRSLSFNAGDLNNITYQLVWAQRALPIPPLGRNESNPPETSSLKNIESLSTQAAVMEQQGTFEGQINTIDHWRSELPNLRHVSAGNRTHEFPDKKIEANSLAKPGNALSAGLNL